MFGFIINAGLSALNIGFYVNDPNPLSLGAAVFCGLMAFACLVMDLS